MYKYDRYDTYVYKVTITIIFNVKCTVRRNKADNACSVHAIYIYNSQSRNNAKAC